MELNYFAHYSFTQDLSFYKGGKESIYNTFVDLISGLEKKGYISATKYKQMLVYDDSIIIKYSKMPFTNLLFNEELRINDNVISYNYEEKCSDQLMLPNIFSYVLMVIILIKTAEKLSQGFDKNGVLCHVNVNHNGMNFFYDKYSPLKVNYSWLHKYKINEKINFDFCIDSYDDIYLLINRIYQQYKTEQSVDKVCVSVDKADFLMKYGEL